MAAERGFNRVSPPHRNIPMDVIAEQRNDPKYAHINEKEQKLQPDIPWVTPLAPVPHLRPGLQYLAHLDQVTIRQQIDLHERNYF